jgi:hypothetical protein
LERRQLRVDTGGGGGVAPGTQRKASHDSGGVAQDDLSDAMGRMRVDSGSRDSRRSGGGGSSKVGDALDRVAAAARAASPAPSSAKKRFGMGLKLDIADGHGSTPRLEEGEAARGGAPNVRGGASGGGGATRGATQASPTRSPMSESGAIRFSGFSVRQEGIRRADGSGADGGRDSATMRDGLIQLELLGKGASGTVYKNLHVPTFKLVAVKMIPVFAKVKKQQMIDEVKALYKHLVPIDESAARSRERANSGSESERSHAPSPFIVSFFDAYHDLKTGHVHLVVELMDGGSLQDIVDTGGCDNEDVLANISVR